MDRIQGDEMAILTEWQQGSGMGKVRLVVDERTEVHAVADRQVLEQMVRAHLVTLGGRIGNAVREKKQVLHDCFR